MPDSSIDMLNILPGFSNSTEGLASSVGIDIDIATGRPDPLINVEWKVLVQFSGLNVDISDYIEDVVLPSIKVDNKQIFRQGTYVYAAKTESVGSITLKVYETSDLIGYRFFRYWKNKVRDPQGNYNPPDQYKGTVVLYPLAPDKSYTAMFEARGCFPISLPSHSFSSGQPERIITEVELSCDRLVPLQAA